MFASPGLDMMKGNILNITFHSPVWWESETYLYIEQARYEADHSPPKLMYGPVLCLLHTSKHCCT